MNKFKEIWLHLSSIIYFIHHLTKINRNSKSLLYKNKLNPNKKKAIKKTFSVLFLIII